MMTLGEITFQNGKTYPICVMAFSPDIALPMGGSYKKFWLTLPIAGGQIPSSGATMKVTEESLKNTTWDCLVIEQKPAGDPDHVQVTVRATLLKGSYGPPRVRHGVACEKALP